MNTSHFSRRRFLGGFAAGCGSLLLPAHVLAAAKSTLADATSSTTRILSMENQWTKESMVVLLEQGAKLSDSVKADFSRFLRDHHSGDIGKMDPNLITHLMDLRDALKLQDSHFHVLSGYRSPRTNAALMKQGRRVAKNSMHLQGRAIDIRVPNRSLKDLRDAALELKAGGVGYYRASSFLHFDTGPVRRW